MITLCLSCGCSCLLKRKSTQFDHLKNVRSPFIHREVLVHCCFCSHELNDFILMKLSVFPLHRLRNRLLPSYFVLLEDLNSGKHIALLKVFTLSQFISSVPQVTRGFSSLLFCLSAGDPHRAPLTLGQTVSSQPGPTSCLFS